MRAYGFAPMASASTSGRRSALREPKPEKSWTLTSNSHPDFRSNAMQLTPLSIYRSLFTCALLSPILFAGSGCSPGNAVVSGEVQLDGVPVENGSITFEPADKKGPTMGGPIVNGRYEVKGPAG